MWPAVLLQERELELVPGQAIQGSLKDALVVLHDLRGEGHRGKGMGMTGNAHLVGFHFKNVGDAGKGLVMGAETRVCQRLWILTRLTLYFQEPPRLSSKCRGGHAPLPAGSGALEGTAWDPPLNDAWPDLARPVIFD